MGMGGYSVDTEARRAEVRAWKESPAPVVREDFVVASGSVSQTELQREIGAVMHRVRRGEAVVVTERGRRDVVIITAEMYDELTRDREEMNGR